MIYILVQKDTTHHHRQQVKMHTSSSTVCICPYDAVVNHHQLLYDIIIFSRWTLNCFLW